ncbi:hypothetical protein TWF970_001358 [Orbilia oligospora]|uniref:HNH nuclease domain-containing protein n=1 Tax=Orbilia oligospora TaxID=2813651 RepID=A0A7C8VKT6_ORBOL|nr:hypothetical protein TWF970_001358 [Orbilia oligospora]
MDTGIRFQIQGYSISILSPHEIGTLLPTSELATSKMDFQNDADETPRPNRRVQHRILGQQVSRLSFTSPSLIADASFASSSSITVNSLLNTDPLVINPGTPTGGTDFFRRSDIERSSTSEPVSRSPSPRKRRHPSSVSQYGSETVGKKSSRSNSRHSSASSRSVASDASTGVRRIEFPRGVKECAKRYYGSRCWLCEHPHRKLNIAHVVPKADIEFESHVSRGILPLTELHDINNAIPLCVACHDPFDAKPPGFIILPIDLEWFVEFERADFSDRQQLLREGKSRSRIAPTGQMYRAHLEREGKLAIFPSPGAKGVNRSVTQECHDEGGLYEVYMRTDHLTNHWEDGEILGLFLQGKAWHGSPTALILHAARVLGYPGRGQPWVSEEKLRLIFELIVLWGREPTSPQEKDESLESSASGGVPQQPNPGADDQSQQGEGEPPRGPPGFDDGFQGGSAGSETAVGTEREGSGYNEYKGHSTTPVDSKLGDRWQWGPLLTANDVVRFFSSVGM